MAAIAQSFAKVPGVAFVQNLGATIASYLDKKTVPHWCDYLNKK